MTISRPRRACALGGVTLAALLLAGCGAGEAGESADDGGETVAYATTTQLGSITAEITECVGTQTVTLMGPGDDPHVFAPSSSEIAEMSRAPLVVANGLGLETSMASALQTAAEDGVNVLEVAPQLDPLPFAAHDGHSHEEHGDGEEHSHDEGDGHDHSGDDPHVWMDVSRMATAAEVIGAELADATGDDAYVDCAAETASGLQETHDSIVETLSAVPEDQRTLMTDHAAYNYLADAYDVEISAVVVPGGSTDGEPSSQDLARLSAQIDAEGVDALVTSVQTSNRLIEALAEESDDEVPLVQLYESGLGEPGSEAETYREAMEYNARTLAEALGAEQG